MVKFFVVLPLIVLTYWYLVPQRWRSAFLLFCSLLFIAIIGLGYAAYLLFNISVVYILGGFISAKPKLKSLLIKLILIWLVGNLCFFKYINVLIDIVSNFGLKFYLFPPLEFPRILLPLGLSYVSFRLIHYIIEIYRENTPRGSFVDFTSYVLFFPTFLAGPVERFPRFYPQINREARPDMAEVNYGLYRIVRGLIKKIIIADNLRNIIMPVLVCPQAYSQLVVILAIYGLAIQIYLDFSGYTDIALGVARMFNSTIMENFNRPFLQKNIALFWRSWHISVYSWIRDYFFFPVFGYKASKFKIYSGIIVTMVVFHLWHRLSLSFLCLGLYHGFGLLGWYLFQNIKNKVKISEAVLTNKFLGYCSIFTTFSFVSFGNIFFAFDFKNALNILSRIAVH